MTNSALPGGRQLDLTVLQPLLARAAGAGAARRRRLGSGRQDFARLWSRLRPLAADVAEAAFSAAISLDERRRVEGDHGAVESDLEAESARGVRASDAAVAAFREADRTGRTFAGPPRVIGLDVVVDANAMPWLIEVNHVPGLAPRGRADARAKHAVVRDAWALAAARAGLEPLALEPRADEGRDEAREPQRADPRDKPEGTFRSLEPIWRCSG